MVTVNTTVERSLNTPAEIIAYLAEQATGDRFKPGDKVKIIDRSGLSVSAFMGDVGIVVGYDTPGSQFTSVRGLYANGVVSSGLVPTAILENYTEEA